VNSPARSDRSTGVEGRTPGTTSGWVCAQIGAREHYAIPRALLRRGLLDRLFTDAWAGPLVRRAGRGPLRSLAARSHPELPDERVVSFTVATFAAALRDRAFGPRDIGATFARHLRIGAAFGRRVARRLARAGHAPRAFFAYNTGALEPLELLAGRGVPTLVGQIDPGRTEEEIVRRECETWPGWAALPGRIPDEYYARLAAEWAAATAVVVNSEWSRQGLIAQGVPPDKVIVLPLAYDAPAGPLPERPPPADELVVLWLGQVILRKGIQHLFAAARLLRSARVRVVVAGPLGISAAAAATAPPNVTLIGPIGRADVGRLYRSADVFVLPTLSDGFAITQLEAMAHGLPVVATPNCARVVTDGRDGLIVPAADPEALAAALDMLAATPARVREMGRRAAETVQAFSVAALSDRLARLDADLAARPPGGGRDRPRRP
jgi:glycosyltransferase involved in cell wall biosynthesis